MEPLAPSSAVETVIEASTVHEVNSEQAAGFNFQPNYGIDGIGIIGRINNFGQVVLVFNNFFFYLICSFA